ncbi:glycosyl transferase family 2 [Chitinophaga niastensis]|uniref:Glycosyl transferase family 2 n=1 Tax=Chitinophaga niastensis TaxID=536980 RepID=A0A2P8HCN3_CHINA|nr:glycosyltransferase family A protein [Chitinophaga niastensis]PSL43871.1 glycosyl transferase family 2 [Chitinophaga niastensis]
MTPSTHEMLSISYCTVSMNRIEQVKVTLPLNIKENERFSNLKFLLLDYNSSDGLEEWVRENLEEHILSGKLTYYKYHDAPFFNASHSRNMLFRLSKNDIICNVDADNIVYGEFTEHIMAQYRRNPEVLIVTDLSKEKYDMRDAVGRFCCRRNDFIQVGGYDESIVGYGFEDVDLYKRISRLGREKCVIDNAGLLAVLNHSDEERVVNDWLVQKHHAIFIGSKEGGLELLILTDDRRYIRGTAITGRYEKENFQFGYDEGPCGEWEHNADGTFTLRPTGGETLQLQVIDEKENYLLSGQGEQLYLMRLTETEGVNKAVMLYRMSVNQEIYQKNIANNHLTANSKGFGFGLVYQNFDTQTPIDLSQFS